MSHFVHTKNYLLRNLFTNYATDNFYSDSSFFISIKLC